MKERAELIIDPLGNSIYLPIDLRVQIYEGLQGEKIFDQLQDVIRKPAILIRSLKEPKERYYFRMISDERGLLLFVKKDGNTGQVFDYIIDPDSRQLMELVATGEIVN